MNELLKLFTILQLAKEQPLTGYLPAGIKNDEMPTLAEHQYNAALMGWLLVQKIREAGGKINERKVVIMLLIHDLSELFGGDIAGPLNRKYPELRDYKDMIGEKAILMLSSFLDNPSSDMLEKFWLEMEAGDTDESVVVKIIDQMDHQFFLERHNVNNRYNKESNDYRKPFVENHIYNLTERIKDQKTKKVMDDFLQEFRDNFFEKGYQGIELLMED